MKTKNYEIGYGKPPEGSRFRKGESGNPKGRPKGTKDFQSDLREVLKAKVTVSENGKPRKVTSQKATLMRLREKALNGDAKAMDKYIDLAKAQYFEDGAREAERRLSKSEDDILERFAASLREEAYPVKQEGQNHDRRQEEDGNGGA